jgi:hypothetical protein
VWVGACVRGGVDTLRLESEGSSGGWNLTTVLIHLILGLLIFNLTARVTDSARHMRRELAVLYTVYVAHL